MNTHLVRRWHRQAAMGLATVILARFALADGPAIFVGLGVLAFILPCILWPDAMGQAVGFSHVTKSSPAPVLVCVGWGLLLPLAWLVIL